VTGCAPGTSAGAAPAPGTRTQALDRLAGFAPRTTLLSPFDRLVHNRSRTEELFGFSYRLEMYVPADRRRYGYYVLPVLHGDALIGRLDSAYDRTARLFTVTAVYAEPDAPAGAGPDVARAIADLARWSGAHRTDLGERLPSAWRRALRAAT
jgi:uncharacterized protein YcaQ